MPKVIMIHGNGGSTAHEGWQPNVQSKLEQAGLEVISQTFPDNIKARATYWLPYIAELGADANTVLIGHSSGAVAAMRYAETHPLLGSVLVGACYTDLGEASERISGYYSAPWNWAAIKANQHWILQYASPDDPYIPVAEARYIQKHLSTKYFELPKRGHFQAKEFPELSKTIIKQLSIPGRA